MQKLSIEMGEGRGRQRAAGTAYGKVHAAGCRDMADEMVLGEAKTLADIPVLIHDETGWETDDDPDFYIGHRAPCVKLPAE